MQGLQLAVLRACLLLLYVQQNAAGVSVIAVYANYRVVPALFEGTSSVLNFVIHLIIDCV
jgi:hypothetical protein